MREMTWTTGSHWFVALIYVSKFWSFKTVLSLGYFTKLIRTTVSLVMQFQNAFSSGCLTHLGQLLSELIQLLLQRSLLLLSGSHLVTNLTDLSRDACCNSNTSGFSSGDISALNREGQNDYEILWSARTKWGETESHWHSEGTECPHKTMTFVVFSEMSWWISGGTVWYSNLYLTRDELVNKSWHPPWPQLYFLFCANKSKFAYNIAILQYILNMLSCKRIIVSIFLHVWMQLEKKNHMSNQEKPRCKW